VFFAPHLPAIASEFAFNVIGLTIGETNYNQYASSSARRSYKYPSLDPTTVTLVTIAEQTDVVKMTVTGFGIDGAAIVRSFASCWESQFCGASPPPVQVSGFEIYAVTLLGLSTLKSEAPTEPPSFSSTISGFSVYTAPPVSAGACSGIVKYDGNLPSQQTGSIRDHFNGMDSMYANNANCEWHISASQSATVTLSFQDFVLEKGFSTVYDFVSVFCNGQPGVSAASATCPAQISGLKQSSTECSCTCNGADPCMMVQFSSDATYVEVDADGKSGFDATYSITPVTAPPSPPIPPIPIPPIPSPTPLSGIPEISGNSPISTTPPIPSPTPLFGSATGTLAGRRLLSVGPRAHESEHVQRQSRSMRRTRNLHLQGQMTAVTKNKAHHQAGKPRPAAISLATKATPVFSSSSRHLLQANTYDAWSVSVGGIPCSIFSATPPYSLMCTLSSGTYDGTTQIEVAIDGVKGSSNDGTFKWTAPALQSVTPMNGPTNGGSVVTVVGSGFGTSDPGIVISVGDTSCLSTAWLSENSASCVLPQGYSAIGTRIGVRVAGAEVYTEGFTYDAPVITGMSACPIASSTSCFTNAFSPNIMMPKSGDGYFTIFGTNFGPSAPVDGISISLADRTCQQSTWLGPNLAVCQLGSTGSVATKATTVSLTVGLSTGTSSEGLYSFESDAMRLSLIASSTMPGSNPGLFQGPNYITCDFSNSFVYVSDQPNQVIKAVHMASGASTVIAGSLQEAGDVDGPGADARFRQPAGLVGPRAISGASWVFLADGQNQKVKAISVNGDSVSGRVATVATGFTVLTAIALSPTTTSTRIYAADVSIDGPVVKLVQVSNPSGGISPIAATSQNFEGGLVIDGLAILSNANQEFLFVAMQNSVVMQQELRVIELSASNGAFVGNARQVSAATSGYLGLLPYGLSSSGTYLYYTESTTNRVIRADFAGLQSVQSPVPSSADILVGYTAADPAANTGAASAGTTNGAIFSGTPPNLQSSALPVTGLSPVLINPPAVWSPVGVCASPSGHELFISDSGAKSIRKLQLFELSSASSAFHTDRSMEKGSDLASDFPAGTLLAVGCGVVGLVSLLVVGILIVVRTQRQGKASSLQKVAPMPPLGQPRPGSMSGVRVAWDVESPLTHEESSMPAAMPDEHTNIDMDMAHHMASVSEDEFSVTNM
jgi:hypothetical protein